MTLDTKYFFVHWQLRTAHLQQGQSAKVKESGPHFNVKKSELNNNFYCDKEARKMEYLAKFFY